MSAPPNLQVVSSREGYAIEADWSDRASEQLTGLFDPEEAAHAWLDDGGWEGGLDQR